MPHPPKPPKHPPFAKVPGVGAPVTPLSSGVLISAEMGSNPFKVKDTVRLLGEDDNTRPMCVYDTGIAREEQTQKPLYHIVNVCWRSDDDHLRFGNIPVSALTLVKRPDSENKDAQDAQE